MAGMSIPSLGLQRLCILMFCLSGASTTTYQRITEHVGGSPGVSFWATLDQPADLPKHGEIDSPAMISGTPS